MVRHNGEWAGFFVQQSTAFSPQQNHDTHLDVKARDDMKREITQNRCISRKLHIYDTIID